MGTYMKGRWQTTKEKEKDRMCMLIQDGIKVISKMISNMGKGYK